MFIIFLPLQSGISEQHLLWNPETMTDLPAVQTAIIGLEDGNLAISSHALLPELEEDMIIVKNVAVALNPVDTKMTGNLVSQGAISGMDFAGIIVAIGSKAQSPTTVAIGDRVCGAVQGMHSLTPRVGAFAEYVGATGFVTLKIPDQFSFDQGASLGSGIGTIGLALFKSLEVPGYPTEPAAKPRHVLIYGGSTATGTMAIQLLKLYITYENEARRKKWSWLTFTLGPV
jgi:NADPH:quinone reductase-like Zn-dependent oxidoreductase